MTTNSKDATLVDDLRREVDLLRAQVASVASANVRAALEMADRHRELEEQSEELRVALREAESASRKKDEFLAKVSHELRTPLNGIIGMTTLLTETVQDEAQHEYARTALESAHTLLEIINDLLDLSKIHAQKVQLAKDEFDLWKLVENITRLLYPKLTSDAVELSSHIAPDVPRFVIGDPFLLRQILMNLCGNAVKFTEEGEVVIGIECDKTLAHTIRVTVRDTGCGIPAESLHEVFESFQQIDNSMSRQHGGTGLGLSICRNLTNMMGGDISVESELGKGSTFTVTLPIEPSESNAITPPHPDVNLVAFVKRPSVVRCMRDHFEAAEVPYELRDTVDAADFGSADEPNLVVIEADAFDRERVEQIIHDCNQAERAVVLLVPLTHGPQWTSQTGGRVRIMWLPLFASELHTLLRHPHGKNKIGDTPSQASVASRRTDKSLNLLVVEDNRINQKVAQRILDRLGHSVILASSGQEALDTVFAQDFDIVLMDCQMPIMDGFEATRRIRASERESGSPRIPIVALTANATQSDIDRCLEAGMDAHLAKPIDVDTLVETLTRWSSQ